jgi:glucose/mannose-6-phosphate isomerase
MTILDDLKKIKEVDQENLADLIEKLPEQLEKVLKEEKEIPTLSYQKIENVLICGMGCDRIVAEIFKKIAEEKSFYPIEIVGDYKLPFFVNEKTLIFLLSYSGETSEILSLLDEIFKLKKKPKIFIIAGGGKLIDLAEKKKIPFYKFFGQGPSRANIGYLFFSLLLILKKINLLKIKDEEIFSLIQILKEFNKIINLERRTQENVAKYLAYQIFDRIPVIVGAEHLWPVAQRWKKEFNENSKTFAFAEEAPEFFHNSIVGIEYPWRIRDEIFSIFLESDFYQKETKTAFSIYKEILNNEKMLFETVPPIGKNKLEEIMTGILLGDWVSFYLAILNKVDPTPVENIELIKRKIKGL